MYSYASERASHARKLIRESGAAMLARIIEGASSGDSFMMLACVDRLVEIGDLREVVYDAENVPASRRIFVWGRGDA